MSAEQAGKISKKIAAARERYDKALRRMSGITDPQKIDEIAKELNEAHKESLATLEEYKNLLKKN